MFSELVEKSRMDAAIFPSEQLSAIPGMAIKRHHHDGRREPQWGELGAKLRKLKREKGKDKRD